MEECEQSQLSGENKEKVKALIDGRIKRLTDKRYDINASAEQTAETFFIR